MLWVSVIQANDGAADNLGSILAVSDWLCRSVRNGTIEHKGPPLTMKTLWMALIKAYEIQGCMLLQNAFHKHGIDHVILVKLASAAVVSWLLGLSEWQTMDAVSQVWMDGQPLRVYRQGGNTIPRKGWAAGDACMKATHLALLTRAGQPGALTPLSMPRWGFYDASFKGQAFELPRKYGSWVVENTIFKVMPVEGHAISSVEAALQHLSAMRAKGLENPVSDIKSILIRTNSATDTIINKQGPLHNAADRDHCLQYIVSLAFLKGSPPEVADYQNNSSWARSIALSRLREKIHVSADERLTQAYLDPEVKSLAAGMEVHLDNGTVLSEIVIDFPIGHSKNANTQTVVRHKARKNLKLMFPAEHVVHLEAAVGDESMAISDFMDMFVPPQSSSRL